MSRKPLIAPRWGTVFVAVEHGYQSTLAEIVGPVAVCTADDINGEYERGTPLWCVIHTATGHLITQPHDQRDVCLRVAQRLAYLDDLVLIERPGLMLTTDLDALRRRTATLAYPLSLAVGTRAAVMPSLGVLA